MNDTKFFENLYDKYSREIYMICFSYCQNKADAEDCLQEVFIRAMSKASEIKKHPAPDKWLFVTAKFISLEKLRAYKKTYRNELNIIDFEAILKNETFENDLSERQYTETDIIILRNDILKKLNKKEQELYILRYIEKSSVENISERLKISYSNTTTRLSRLKAKILKSINEVYRNENEKFK